MQVPFNGSQFQVIDGLFFCGVPAKEFLTTAGGAKRCWDRYYGGYPEKVEEAVTAWLLAN